MLCCQKREAIWKYHTAEESWRYTLQVSLLKFSVPVLSDFFSEKYIYSNTKSVLNFGVLNDAINCWCLVVFRFLFDKSCPDYKYYEFRLAEEEKVLSQSKEAEASKNGLCQKFLLLTYAYKYSSNSSWVVMPYAYVDAANTSMTTSKVPSGSRSSFEQKSNYQIPASALYGAYEGSSTQGSSSSHG